MRNALGMVRSLQGKEFEPLEKEEEIRLAKEAEAGDLAARDQLITHNLRLVNSIASSYKESNVPMEDIIQAGNTGLILSLNTYDYRKARFTTHATKRIMAEISKLFDNAGRVIDIPLPQARAIKMIVKREKQMSQELGRQATVEEMLADAEVQARAAKVKKDPLLLLSLRNSESISLDQDTDPDNDNTNILNMIPDTSAVDPGVLLAREDLLNYLLKDLSERERTIIRLYFGLDGPPMTLREIAIEIGKNQPKVKQQRIQQILQNSLEILQERWANQDELLEIFS